MSKEQCSEKVYEPGAFRSRPCAKPAKVQVDGKWYCGTHDPAKVAARRKKAEEKWDREAQVATYERKIREAKEAVVSAALAWDAGELEGARSLGNALIALRALKAAKP